jgi:hypothetical protein
MADSTKLEKICLALKEIDGYQVQIYLRPLETLNRENRNPDACVFNGQKLGHPFIFDNITVKDGWSKNPNKTRSEPYYTHVFTSPEAEADVVGAIVFEIKLDGQCGKIVVEDGKIKPYKRHELHLKKELADYPPASSGETPCEPKPNPSVNREPGWPHMNPLENDSSASKHNFTAFETAQKSGKLEKINRSFTCEYMGKQFNGKSCDPVDSPVIVPHGLLCFDIPKELRNYVGFLKIVQAFPSIEGFMIYGKNNIWKVRRDMFLVDGHKLKWPTTEVLALARTAALN